MKVDTQGRQFVAHPVEPTTARAVELVVEEHEEDRKEAHRGRKETAHLTGESLNTKIEVALLEDEVSSSSLKAATYQPPPPVRTF